MPGQANYSMFEKLPELLGLNDSLEGVSNEYLHSCHVMVRDNFPVGRFAIYRNDDLLYKGMKAICIGAYHCIDDDFLAKKLLNYASNICKDLGYEFIIGPMNGSTWNKYRFADKESINSFFLDVQNPAYYNRQFGLLGFETIAKYFSNLDDDLNFDKESLISFEKYFAKRGANIRNISLVDFENELVRIADFSNLAFSENFLFTPIDREKFVQQYLKLRQIMNPKFIWIVEDSNKEIQSIFFAINDITDKEGKTLIIKSIAVRKNSPYKGIATYLARRLNQIASEMGYEKIIHALMIKDNLSMNASKKFGHELRSYSLYGKQLNG